MTEFHTSLLTAFAFVCGIACGMHQGKELYRRLLVLIAKAGTAEKLPDGKFYYIVQEGKK